MKPLNRRRFFTISAAACVMPRFASASVPTATWRGIALGAHAQMQIAGLSQGAAQPIFKKVEAEINRLEDIFSLYRPTSMLNQLNQFGKVAVPPPELLELCSVCASIHAATNGAFDPTVQPLWSAIARGADASELEQVKSLVGWQGFRFDSNLIRFDRTGMALTFNGIAQGYIADRVALIMRRVGLTDLVINTGEIMALGGRGDGRAWRAGVRGLDGIEILARIDLTDRALATSAPMGSTIGASGVTHILDPRTGVQKVNGQIVSVSADKAAIADGLSTAFTLMKPSEIEGTLRVFEQAKLEYRSL